MGRQPFARWSDNDHSGPVIIATVLGLVYWLVPAVGQQTISFGQRSSLTWASRLYLASMVAGFAQSVVLLVAVSRGFGKSIAILPNGHATSCLQLYHASNVLYVIVLGLAKCSATCSIISLTVPNRGSIKGASRRNKAIFAVVTAVIIVWMIAAIVSLGLQCEPGPSNALRVRDCNGTFGTWAGIFASDGVTDMIVAAFAASIIMPTKARFSLKLVWYIPFLLRFCVIVLSGARLASFHPSGLRDDPTKAMWLFAVLSQIQIFLSLIAAGFPALKRTVLDLATNFGVSEQTRNHSQKGSAYILSSLTRKSKQRGPQEGSSSSWPFGAGAGGETVIRTGASRAPSDDGSQRGIMRRDEYEITVTNHDGSEEGSR